MTFANPYLALLPLAALAAALLVRRAPRAVVYPDAQVLTELPRTARLRLRAPVLGLCMLLFAGFAGIAAMRPQQLSAPPAPQKARNVMLVLDISRSMTSEDFRAGGSFVSRVKAVKAVVQEFIAARRNDAMGVVVFGSTAFLQAPLTLDHELLQQLVSRLEPGMAGDATAMGDGLGIAVKRIQQLPSHSKTIILLTDGVSNAGHLNPLKAAKVARDLGITIHTIGIGSTQGSVTIRGGPFPFGPVTQSAEFDEKTLTEIAEITGGHYFNANTIEGLKEVYAAIDRLQETEQKAALSRIATELFFPYGLVAFAAYLLMVMLRESIFLRIPE